MNKCIKIAVALSASVALLSGCNSLTPKEWFEKQIETGTAYGEQL